MLGIVPSSSGVCKQFQFLEGHYVDEDNGYANQGMPDICHSTTVTLFAMLLLKSSSRKVVTRNKLRVQLFNAEALSTTPLIRLEVHYGNFLLSALIMMISRVVLLV